MNDKDIKDEKLEWEAVKVIHYVQDKYIDFREVEYRLPDGKIGKNYYNYSRKDYVIVVASDEEGRFICVKQFRHGIGEVTIEFPAGGIESEVLAPYTKSGKNPKCFEDAFEAAKRELREETGYVSEEWSPLIAVPSNATVADNYAFIYVAKNCKRTTEQELDDNEFIDVYLKSAEEIDELISKGGFQQAIHIMAWEMLKAKC